MVVQVKARRSRCQVNPVPLQDRDATTNGAFKRRKQLMPRFQEKPLSIRQIATVPQTDTGGRVENTKALERTRVKELGKMAP